MPGKVIGTSMNVGFPGSYARTPDCIMKARKVKTTGFDFGDPVVLNTDNTYTKFGASGTLAKFAGFAVREVKQFAGSFTSQGDGSYAVGDVADVLERGEICVTVTRGTPVAGGAVYVRTVLGGTPDSGAVVGGIEAEAPGDGGTSIQLTNCAFSTGEMDANGVAEVVVKTRNNA
ncbi:MAG: hypothetical protein A4E65_00335 [Syntrophorhabdus sp. PtaU1.Bin153]|nr:MAG: hypothetical protein A4E65_00335 [Syntrophorhabdus sp. PtaU1.Bin153]